MLINISFNRVYVVWTSSFLPSRIPSVPSVYLNFLLGGLVEVWASAWCCCRWLYTRLFFFPLLASLNSSFMQDISYRQVYICYRAVMRLWTARQKMVSYRKDALYYIWFRWQEFVNTNGRIPTSISTLPGRPLSLRYPITAFYIYIYYTLRTANCEQRASSDMTITAGQSVSRWESRRVTVNKSSRRAWSRLRAIYEATAVLLSPIHSSVDNRAHRLV